MLSNKQQKDLEITKWFIPDNMKHIPVTEDDIKCYFENSEKGMHRSRVKTETLLPIKESNGFAALMIGKTRREVNIAMYKTDFSEYLGYLKDVWLKDMEFPEFIREEIKQKL